MTRRTQAITLSISQEDKSKLEALALALGMTWGERANISKFVEAIARKELLVAPNHDWRPERFHALNQARLALINAGQFAHALDIAQLLLGRTELEVALQMELEQFLAQSTTAWRLELERCIQQEKPFQLSFQDAAGGMCKFTIRYGQIVPHDNLLYLNCWADETEGAEGQLPELSHNRTLRLDRIGDAAISRVSGQWRGEGLATIPVEFHLFGGLAFSYQSEADEVNHWHEDLPQVRRVVRQVPNAHWFIREILQYGQDCEVISPESVRQLMRQEVLALYNLYPQH